jgi:hypothetical protein
MPRVENDHFLVTIISRNGEQVTINPQEGFDLVFKDGYSNTKLHNCKATMFENNNYSPLGGFISHMDVSCPTFSFDIYPEYFTKDFDSENKEEKTEKAETKKPVETDSMTDSEYLDAVGETIITSNIIENDR